MGAVIGGVVDADGELAGDDLTVPKLFGIAPGASGVKRCGNHHAF